jgi:hypothetical protein
VICIFFTQATAISSVVQTGCCPFVPHRLENTAGQDDNTVIISVEQTGDCPFILHLAEKQQGGRLTG